jgi:hypothetical protein
MDQLSLENFENSRIELLVCQKWFVKNLFLSLLSKVGLLWGEWLIMGKGGVFEICKKQNQVVAKNDPNMPNLIQNKYVLLFALMLHFF